MGKIKRILLLVVLVALFYTRFVNLSWGLPYPFHPDERNMANAVQQLHCEFSIFNFQFSDCLNPHFFAYGQFPLYLSYFGIQTYHFVINQLSPINFAEAAMALRIISAISSILNVFVLIAIIKLLSKKAISYWLLAIGFLIFTFSPALIQFAHFGTTESLLMLLYSLIIYYCLLLINNKILNSKFLILNSLFLGLTVATKVSSLIFAFPVIMAILVATESNLLDKLFTILKLGAFTLVFSVIFSPYNFIAFNDFLGAMRYESDVALGNYLAFYTRQFFQTAPVLFQAQKIFPYSLGWPVFILFILGFIFLPWKKNYNFLRFSFLAFFLPSAFIYAKWTRFMTPVIPIMLAIAVLFFIKTISNIKNQILKIHIKNKKAFYIFLCHFAFLFLIFVLITPGIAFLSVYTNRDVRYTVSDWIFNNIPTGSYILSETANVVDLPILNPNEEINQTMRDWNGNYISFDFYHLDEDPVLQNNLEKYLINADYIFIPSRRIFYNHKTGYSILNKYYENLFSGKLGFEKVVEFTSYPKIEIFGKKLLEFPDEQAEETWTVFDHPVFRIYKRI